jgi:hypothetical protein
MSDTILQNYLNNQFIKTSDEGNIASLKKAVIEIVKRLEKKKEKIISFTLVAIDPLVPENDPVVLEVERIIISKWSAFKNSVTATNDKSITYIRAVILQALSQLTKDDNSAAIIWLTGRNSIKHFKLSNQENGILSEFLIGLGNRLEMSAQLSWSGNNNVKLPDFSLPANKLKTTSVSQKYLTERLKAAAGISSQDENGTAITYDNSNRYWTNQNANWTHDFGKIAGEALATAFNNVLSTQNLSIKDVNDTVNRNMELIIPYIKNVGNEISSKIDTSNLRSKLLWWKESLYSNRLKKSYRETSSISTAVIMAMDLSEMINPIYPLSVDYFLKETLKDLYPEDVDQEIELAKLLQESNQMEKVCIELVSQLANDSEGRKQLLIAFANNVVNTSYDIYSETGLNKKTKVTLGDLAVWFLHDLQAIKIANAK